MKKVFFVLILMVTIFHFTSEAQADVWAFAIDCNETKGLRHEKTKNKITIKFWNGSTLLYTTSTGVGLLNGPGTMSWIDIATNISNGGDKCYCNWYYDAHYIYDSGHQDITHVTAETNGDDALFIDECSLKRWRQKMTSNGAVWVLKKTYSWGVDNGNGWCLSTDSGDASGAWESRVDGCYKAIKYDTNGKAYILRR